MLIHALLALAQNPLISRPATPGRLGLVEGWLQISGGRIASLGRGRPPGTPDLGSTEHLVLPGFIDAHLHLPQFDSIGSDGLELLQWLDKVIFPAESRWADADIAAEMAGRVGRRLASVGTTGIAAYATVHHAAALAAAESLHSWGGRAIIGQVLMDQQAPDSLTRPASQLLPEAAGFIETVRRRHGGGRVEPAVTPRFAVSCSRELLSKAGALAKATQTPVQTHLSETQAEIDLVAQLHDGLGYVEVYDRAGLLGNRTILGHGIWLNDRERARLAETSSVVAHCPGANLFLNSGAMSLNAHRSGGVRMALGSDIAGGPDVSMVRVARSMIETAKRLGGPLPTAAEAWWQITAGNALALGWTNSGRLEPGCDADIVVVKPDGLAANWAALAADPLSMLLYGWDDRWITHTLIAGRVAYQRCD